MLNIAAGISAPSSYNIDKSLRFRASASAYLNKTFSNPPATGLGRTWTLSKWVKRGTLSTSQALFSSGEPFNTAGSVEFLFNSSNVLNLNLTTFGLSVTQLITTQVFRDPSAWYHIVLAIDTTQATASNRVKLYVNGAQVTAFSTANYPAQNEAFTAFTNYPQNIGRFAYGGTGLFDGYMAEIVAVDGQALTPASFGSTNALTGVWQPKAYTGTYGTNGFYLDFEDTSSVAALGTDSSGNSNTWTVNNISLTAGATYDSMTDVPTLTSATAANYAVLNPLSKFSGTVLSEGNLKIASGGTEVWYPAASSIKIPTSGKYYCEFTIGALDLGVLARHYIGIITDQFPISTSTGIGNSLYGWGYYADDGSVYNNTIVIASLTASTTNDVIGVAFNSDAGTLRFYKNGSAMGSDLTGFTSSYYFACATFGNSSPTGFINFGQRPFAYTPPTGFVALNTFNLPTSTILKGNTVMDATLYTGNGSTQTITNAAGFRPDFIWLKSRSAIGNSSLTDSVRGVNSQLYSSLTNAEGSQSDQVTAFNTNGFALGANAAGTGSANINAVTYVGWQWQAGQGSSGSNTNGTITSQVSVNAAAGFSVVTYTGTGAIATIGHGLGVAPKTIFVKERSLARSWRVYNVNLAAANVLYLDATDASTSEAASFNSTAPTSSVFSVGSGAGTNESANTYVAYCWSEIDGFSRFGSYTGNGSTDGVFVYLGFRPKYVMFKRTNSADQWIIEDAVRSTFNLVDARLFANLSDAEVSNGNGNIDFLSNGFKLRNSQSGMNASGGAYIYMAYAENPFKNSLGR